MTKMKNIVAVLFVGVILSCTNNNKESHVANYGAVGDGISDDGPAIRKAVAAAIKARAESGVLNISLNFIQNTTP